MNAKGKHIIITYEHQSVKLGETENFEQKHLLALQRYYGEKGMRFFSLIHNGVKFNQFVGVIQVDALVIEVLPKTDQTGDECHWRKLLIGMLRAVHSLNVHTSGSSDLKLKSNSILDLYLEVFISEVEQLLYKGLIKQYRRREGNSLALKGKLVFTKHIQQNLIHQEQFYVNHQTYDRENAFNQIIYKALLLVRGINTSTSLQSRIGSLLLYFPIMNDIYVTEETFSRLQFNRKTEPYREAIIIARLLLLNYHPDVSRGNNHVMTLMFDMNNLWELFILQCLKKYSPPEIHVLGKVKKTFWENNSNTKIGMEPDIVIKTQFDTYILDTKWKILNGNRPADDDLKQMYVYTKYFESSHTALVYPNDSVESSVGVFRHERNDVGCYPCSVIKLKVAQDLTSISAWQEELCNDLLRQIGL